MVLYGAHPRAAPGSGDSGPGSKGVAARRNGRPAASLELITDAVAVSVRTVGRHLARLGLNRRGSSTRTGTPTVSRVGSSPRRCPHRSRPTCTRWSNGTPDSRAPTRAPMRGVHGNCVHDAERGCSLPRTHRFIHRGCYRRRGLPPGERFCVSSLRGVGEQAARAGRLSVVSRIEHAMLGTTSGILK
jgi:hypothetical protein